MARKLTGAQHEAKALEAWQMSVQGHEYPAIAAKLGVSTRTVATMVKEQRARARDEQSSERADWVAEFTAEQHAAMVASWGYGTDKAASNTSRAAHIANYQKSSESVAKARGLFIDKLALADKDGNTLDPIDALRALIAEHPPA